MYEPGETQGAPRSFRDQIGGRVNTPVAEISRQIRRNIRRPLPQVQWHQPNGFRVALLLGGPSLAGFTRPRGYKVATVNASHDWALDRGYRPSVHVMLDARAFNARFVTRPQASCRYLINSQCHPDVFDALARYDVHLWHGVSRDEDTPDRRLLDRHYLRRWLPIMGGSSVGTRAIGLLYVLGVRTIRIWGMDSSIARDGRHHAYAQTENDPGTVCIARVGRRRYRVYPWMLAQVDDFLRMAPHLPDDLSFGIEGDGLLPHIVHETRRTGRAPLVKVES